MQTEGVTLPRSGRAARRTWPAWRCRKSRARTKQRDARRKTLHDVMELAAKFFEATLAGRGGAKARGYLADRGLDCRRRSSNSGSATRRSERFALKEHLGSARHSGAGHDRGRPADRRRRHPGAVRPLPRPRDVSDRRHARPRHRVRRPRAGEGRAGEISQLAGDAALSQRRDALQHRRRAPGRA